MKYNDKNKPLVCMMTQSTCYKGTRKFTPKGVLWHSTGANNPNLKRYVQPDDNAADRAEWLNRLGKSYKELEEVIGHRGGQPHFLYGKVFCGDCGSPMTRRTVNGIGGVKCKTWVCRSKRSGSGCKGRNAKEDEILAAGEAAKKIVVTHDGIEVA